MEGCGSLRHHQEEASPGEHGEAEGLGGRSGRYQCVLEKQGEYLGNPEEPGLVETKD